MSDDHPSTAQTASPEHGGALRFSLLRVLLIVVPIQIGMGIALVVLTEGVTQWLAAALQGLTLSLVALPGLWWLREHTAQRWPRIAHRFPLPGAHARLRIGYGGVLAVMALIIVCGAWVIQHEITLAKGRGALIENANRQRIVSDQFEVAVKRVATRTVSSRADFEQILQLAVDLTAALDVIEQDSAMLQDTRQALVPIFAEARADVRRFAMAANAVETARNESSGPRSIALTALQWLDSVQSHQRSHANAMDRAIATLAATADARVLHIGRVCFVVSALLLGSLILAVCIVLEPAAIALEQQTIVVRASERRYRALVEGTDVIVWEFDPARNAFIYVSPQAARLGYPPAQWLEPGFWAEHLHPEDRDRAVQFWHDETAAGRNHRFQYRMVDADGQTVWMDDWVSVETGADGARRMRGVLADITELKRAQETLRATEERWNLALQGSGDGVWDWDIAAGHIFRSASWKETLGYSDDEVSSRAGLWQTMIHPDDAKRARAQLDAHVRGESPAYRSEHRMRYKDGSYKWVLARGKIVRRSADGRPLRVVGTQTDISAQKALEDELQRHHAQLQDLVDERTADLTRAMVDAETARVMAERANKSKSMFLANMSHELRTPMHAILSFARLGSTRIATAEPARLGEYFQRIETSGERLLKLLNDLLDLSKLEAGHALIAPADVDCAAMVEAVADELGPLIQQRAHRLHIDATAAFGHVWIDRERMSQVMRNLIANAIRFTPAGGLIEIRFDCVRERTGAYVLELEVTDEGIGIPPGEFESIFDEFVQSSTTVTAAGGTGLGLAICRRIVEAHDGTISARNNAAGGAQFSIRIPQPARNGRDVEAHAA